MSEDEFLSSSICQREYSHKLDLYEGFIVDLLTRYSGYSSRQIEDRLKERYGEDIPQDFRNRFRQQSLPLMKWANILTFNTRAFTLYIGCLIDKPWIFPVFELTVLLIIYLYMHYKHEHFCRTFADELQGTDL
jgi:hypothetical protein